MKYVIRASYGNDSVALIWWAHQIELEDAVILYNDTKWASNSWMDRVGHLEEWAQSLGFTTARTESIGLEELVKNKKGWPRQGMQFCTAELKIKPTLKWLEKNDPYKISVGVVGVRRAESHNRRSFPMYSEDETGRTIWAPLVDFSDMARDALLAQAGIDRLPHRSMECFPCINSNRSDILMLSEDLSRIDKISSIEEDLGYTSKGKPRTMFRPYRHMGATGIKEIVRWAKSPRGKFDLDDGNGSSGCEAGWCGL